MTIADFLLIILKLAALFTILSVVVLGLTWLERKVLARLQGRLGPTRTGPMGLLQPLADALKLVLKEDIIPAAAEKAVFWTAPVIVVISAFVIWVTIPASQTLVVQNLDLGVFYIIAFSVVGILGLLMAGWGSANKYGALGGLRAAAQLISYEIPLIMVVVAVAMLAQSLDLRVIVEKQASYPYLLVQPLGLAIFFIAGLAEVGRTPFDIYHAESEVVGGPFVEYSGAHWAVFFLAEYINTFAVSVLTALLFLGGWSGPFFLPPVVWLLLKTLAVVLVIFWVRGTFPRLRIDQLMAFAWKALVPLSFYTIVITAVYQFYGWPAWSLTLMSLAGLAGVGYIVYQRMPAPARLVKQVQARQRAAMQSRRPPAAGGTPPAPQPASTQGPG